ncbi:DUF2524 domain-containing protein [Paenibacillus oenotherae]|uniref:DUF2524 domain-containing protein n=1 Tax=Paenibacillus oenotherae TaxID=1435645 RepID=A0ABS7D337_9BACL|nr:DUF2524 domain-containing protein [Paenibacillus oenotherae]MBW7473603.1 DUF2524 domain-containing protein [Paenibacillus oenotherae]
MLNHLESSYDCARASEDLHSLKQELEAVQQGSANPTPEQQEQINRIENQIRFIGNKCDIPTHN